MVIQFFRTQLQSIVINLNHSYFSMTCQQLLGNFFREKIFNHFNFARQAWLPFNFGEKNTQYNFASKLLMTVFKGKESCENDLTRRLFY